MENLYNSHKEISGFDKVTFFLCIIDILFLPFIRILSVKASMIFLLLWYFIGGIKKVFCNKKTIIKVLIMFFLAFISVLISFAFKYGIYNQYNLKSEISNFIIIIFAILFIEFFKYIFELKKVSIKKLLFIYLGFAFIFMIIYWVNPQAFFSLRQRFTLNNVEIIYLDTILNRFCFLASDPNNFAAQVTVIMLYLKYEEKCNNIQMIIIYLICALLAFSTLSLTGSIIFSVSFLFCLSVNSKEQQLNIRIFIKSLIYISAIVLSAYILINYSFIKDTQIYNNFLLRLETYSGEDNITGSRFKIWLDFLENKNIFKYLLFGEGTQFFIDGNYRAPHSGHLHLIYGYGLIFYCLFLTLFFPFDKAKKITSKFILFIILIIFSMNTMLGDIRVLFFFTVIVGKIFNEAINIKK